MRTSLLTILFAIACLASNLSAQDSPISVTIAIPADEDGARSIADRNTNSHFHVIVSNTGDKPQRIWQERNSWGYFGLTFEITDETGKKWVVKKKNDVQWTMNFPSYWTLAGHDSLVIEVNFADLKIWEGFPRPENGSQTVTMRAVFEFSPEAEARKADVWTGQVVSKAEKFTFYH